MNFDGTLIGMIHVGALPGSPLNALPLDKLIGQARENEEVRVPEDKVACPTYSLDYARSLEPLLTAPVGGAIFHLCNSGSTSWFGFAEHIVNVLKELGEDLALQELVPTRSAEVANFVAPRPLRTALGIDAYREVTKRETPGWQGAVRRHLEGLFG